ncbi:putative sensor histidine kinase pdtaS [compost metagenome]
MAVNTTPPAFPTLADLVPQEGDRRWIQNLSRHLAFLADIMPADLLIYCPNSEKKLVVVSEAKPTVRESFYRRSQVGQMADPGTASALYQAFKSGEVTEGAIGKVVNGQPMSQMIYPMRAGKRTCAILVVERNLYEELKHTEEKRQIYRTAISRAVVTLINKSKTSDVSLPPLQPGDALLLVDSHGVIKHATHSAVNLARRMGLPEFLDGLGWEETMMANRERRTTKTNVVYEDMELLSPRMALAVRTVPLDPADETVATIRVLRDFTELKEKDRELAIKETIIREVHHRVKNNLQTIAGLLRLQQRRSRNSEVKGILSECIDRISSIALVHEYLSQDDVGVVDIKELAYNLLSAALQSMLPPDSNIDARVVCPSYPITLPSAQATSMALIINELLQNTLKHAFTGRTQGRVELGLALTDSDLTMMLCDNGIGLPKDFDPKSDGNLGWEIIDTLARQDLRGDIKIESSNEGTIITVTIPVAERG